MVVCLFIVSTAYIDGFIDTRCLAFSKFVCVCDFTRLQAPLLLLASTLRVSVLRLVVDVHVWRLDTGYSSFLNGVCPNRRLLLLIIQLE